MTTTTPGMPAARLPDAPAAVEPRSPARVWWRAYHHHLRLLRNTAVARITGLTAISAGVVVPAAWLALGVGVAVLGVGPRLTGPLIYGLVVAAFLLDFVGPFLDLPQWMLGSSPFGDGAAVPAVDMNVSAALAMLAVGAAAGIVGVLASRRRDLEEA